MKKTLMVLMALTVMTLTSGCAKSTGEALDGNNEASEQKKGITYDMISANELSENANDIENTDISLAGMYLYYDGAIYTYYMDCINEIKADDIDALAASAGLGEELADLKYNRKAYATDEKVLGVTLGDAKLYSLRDYDKDFCVAAVRTSEDASVVMRVFTKYNGITLEKGSELYKDRLHLENASKIEYVNEGNNVEINVGEATVKTFVDAVTEGIFTIETPNGIENAFDFYSQNGIKTRIYVYADGYVSLRTGTDAEIILKTDSAKCEKLIELIK